MELMSGYHHEAVRCARAKAYLAATVMRVAAFEAGLQAMCFLYPSEVKRTKTFARKQFRGTRYRALEFSLYQLINIAEELGWFPAKKFIWAGKRATVGGFAHEIRLVRNNVHPGEWVRGRPLRFSKNVFGVIDEVVEVANSWLLHRLSKSNTRASKRKRKMGGNNVPT